ncbi:MAG: type IV secretion system DNA-binding domain-containing protein [Bdellovibrionaceae bacterium]|nr:type IV secretion system DNA-binding domain-containing protein [Pseudobdellovibrionaceae bacterium]
MNDTNYTTLLLLPVGLLSLWLFEIYSVLSKIDRLIFVLAVVLVVALLGLLAFYIYSPWARENRKRISYVKEIPLELLSSNPNSIVMGLDTDLGEKIYLPDHIRTRHVHILGATGSGKTESVILNFLKQDVRRGLGSIILDAKGDHSFLSELKNWVPRNRLLVFDLTDSDSLAYNPLESGSPLESAQRLFSSMSWSEEYYKSKALSALQRIFQTHFEINNQNPTLSEIAKVLETPDSFSAYVNTAEFPQALAVKEFQDLSGLRDQVRSLTMGHLGRILSPTSDSKIHLADAEAGAVIYFRLQSLMSPQIVSVLGKLIINHLGYLAGTAHRGRTHAKQKKIVPVYFDEFASFACPEFADLISKARSAGFALHFSHQSVGDVVEVSPGFLNRITDNAATKIVLRINDPDSAEFFARCFGTKDIQKTTQRITNAKDIDAAEVVGEGTTRDAHQFRASPDLLKTLPTGTGAVLIAHGRETPHGASSVFKVRFPEIKQEEINTNAFK